MIKAFYSTPSSDPCYITFLTSSGSCSQSFILTQIARPRIKQYYKSLSLSFGQLEVELLSKASYI